MRSFRCALLKVKSWTCYNVFFYKSVAAGVKNDHVNIEEKRGYIKEYIEVEGSGIIYSQYVHVLIT